MVRCFFTFSSVCICNLSLFWDYIHCTKECDSAHLTQWGLGPRVCCQTPCVYTLLCRRGRDVTSGYAILDRLVNKLLCHLSKTLFCHLGTWGCAGQLQSKLHFACRQNCPPACQCPKPADHCMSQTFLTLSDHSLLCSQWGAMRCSHLKKHLDQERSLGLSYQQKMGKQAWAVFLTA